MDYRWQATVWNEGGEKGESEASWLGDEEDDQNEDEEAKNDEDDRELAP